ncbi:DUF3841 domain-containing protein [Rhodocytophaga rosea]|uniref:DUF3841 domain-containing protein n=1 Tax=Rhodocytophaga rosea TaxID=2704465 RepID=A0A6C0GNJ5_9BACT|nr:DUF3841 domain-containing protein [Rhodocytophaga rosea]QHT69507.1 DUF3841 domain-containing protein [Rhodocytophaga rosea]
MFTNQKQLDLDINPMLEKKYRLWTFQATEAIEELKTKGILQIRWDEYSPKNNFVPAYQWMAKQMETRNISCNNHAPVWAWHSCTTYEKAPTLVDARCLLSDMQIEFGIQTIEFECPAELVLLSRYGEWNVIFFDFFPYDKAPIDIDKKTENRLFATERKQFRKYDSIQASLPYLKLEWVKDIRDLNLKPGDRTYNKKELV